MEENVNNKNKVIIFLLVVIVALLIIIIGFVTFNMINNKENKEKGDNNPIVENNEKVENNNQENQNNNEIVVENKPVVENQTPKTENKPAENNQPQNNNNTNEFKYSEFNLKLINELKNVNNIYAIDLKENLSNQELKGYSLFARFTDESSVEFANISGKEPYLFESRSLDVENNKLYFIFGSKNKEVYYIDLNNLKDGAKKLEDFNKASSGQITTIFVKNNDIYFSSSTNKNINKYNTQTKKVTTIISGVDWYNYYVDKSHSTIFFSKDFKMYMCNLDGNNSAELNFGMSDYLNMAVYKGNPVFQKVLLVSTEDQVLDLYEYNYTTKSFNKLKGEIHDYKVKYNSIEVYSKLNNEFSRSFYINK